MTTARDVLLDWLRNAHAMEVHSEEMLKSQMRRIEHYPQLRERIERHLTETREQQAMLAQCLKQLGAEPSAIKELGARFAALGQGLFQVTAADEIIKSAISASAFERMEITVYRTLIAAAKTSGEDDVARICQTILPQEQAMADWLDQHLPELVEQYMARVELPNVTAKR
ncbi:ferritin-like domain-containing protein [Dyella sp.]|uniref:ferritin-like domain-containing protein n=1 Tax=Dyella sp. TaxID=1869338 RepID=UPI002ED5ABB3